MGECVFSRFPPPSGLPALPSLLGFLALPLLAAAAGAFAAAPGAAALPVPFPTLAMGCASALLPAGLAAWRVWRRTGGGRALRMWGWQMLPHAVWPPLLFTLGAPALATLAALVMGGLAATVARDFFRLDRVSAWLMLPAAVWAAAVLAFTLGFR